MPKRMLTTRCQNVEPQNADDVFVDIPKNFRFDFRDGQAIFAQPPLHGQRRQGVCRTNTVKLERQCTTPELRVPARDDGPTGAVDKRLQSAKVDDNCIGIAFGSPTHPLSGWTEDTSPVSATQPSRTDIQLLQQTPSKWKKIGGIFRAKSPPQIQPPKNPMRDDFDPEQYKLGIPVRRVPWRNPHSPLAVPGIERESIEVIDSSDLEASAARDKKPENDWSAQKQLPILEVEIPPTEMERYSIMFRDINGDYSPALSVRRNRMAADLRALQVDNEYDSPPLPIPMSIPMSIPIAYKATTNTPPKTPYRLFPSPPKTKIFDYLPSSKSTEALLHVRSVSAPATLSPCLDRHKISEPCKARIEIDAKKTNQVDARRASITEGEILQPTTYNAHALGRILPRPQLTIRVDSTKLVAMHETKETSQPATKTTQAVAGVEADQDFDLDQVELDKPLPLRPRRGPSSDISPHPEDNIAVSDKEDTPWVSKESLRSPASSRTSIEDEIFFDIKSCRGSKDQGISQFVISRPDSTAVQHARSMSRKVKIREPDCTPLCHDVKTQPVLFCMPPDLQAAEYCCLAAEPKVDEQRVRLSMFDEAIAEVERLASPSEAVSPLTATESTTEATDVERRPTKPKINIPTRLPGHSIAFPSPIMERSEESTPISALSKSPIRRLRHIASQASHSSISLQSSTSSVSDIPPPVPEKDTKFLPISKYSAHRQPVNIASSAQHRCHAPSKSVAERSVFTDQPLSSTKSGRSASFSVRSATKKDKHVKSSSRRPFDQNTIAVSVHPTAECSMARTVSLRRKTSHQVLVPRSSSLDRGDDSRQQFKEEERLHWSTDKRAMSPVVVLNVPRGHKPGASVNLVVESV